MENALPRSFTSNGSVSNFVDTPLNDYSFRYCVQQLADTSQARNRCGEFVTLSVVNFCLHFVGQLVNGVVACGHPPANVV